MSLPGSTATPEPFFFSTFCADFMRVSRLLDRELGDALAVLDVRVEPHLERILDDLRDELQRVAARELFLHLALELRIEDARGEHEAQLRRHVLGLQPHAARQQAVVVDERLDRLEQRRAQARLVRAAGRRGDQVDVALALAAAFLVPRDRPRGAFAFGERVAVLRLAEVRLALEDRRDRLASPSASSSR